MEDNMKIPKGFRKLKDSTVISIIDKFDNVYIKIPKCGEKPAFWISQYEISHNSIRNQIKHPAASLENKKPWTFISLFEARDVAQKEGGRLPTEEEYERYYKFCKENHLIENEDVFIWTETREDRQHYVSRKGNEREICYPNRQTNYLSFRIVLDAA